ncbi:MAG: restriction endonuclease [Rhodospirillales bacterium]|nr:restriction endonuclease [Rhodospirillales bacterium]
MTKKSETSSRFVRYFGPILDALRALGGSGSPREVIQKIVQDLNIPEDVQNELLPSGQSRFENQVAWARYYLVQEGLLESSKRGVWSLSERGRHTHLSLAQAQEISRKGDRAYQKKHAEKGDAQPIALEVTVEHPSAHPDYRSQLVELMRQLPPAGFERLSQRLLREAGFSQVVVTGKSNDGGIDGHGTLQVNPLVSFKVLFQCKRYANSVSSPDIRNFRGAMAGRADKGIIITTGTFTAEALREASRDGVPPIELIDGERLIDLLERLELGLKPVQTYAIDESFFNEFRS